MPFLLVVNPGLPAANLKEFIALGKSQPGRINFASPGVGTPNHLGAELLKVMTGFQFVHVPYKGGAIAILDVMAGRAQALFGGIPYTGSHAKAGRVRAIAIGHPTRMASWPDVPPVAETLPGFSNTTWYGLLAPAGTPRPVVDRINAEMKKALANPGFIKQLEALGLEPAASSPAEFHDMIRTTSLIVCTYRAVSNHFPPDKHVGFEAAAWYWHFVDVVWLFLFAAIYIWGSAGGAVAAH